MHNGITIRQASLDDLDLLIHWRMEVLHCVFSIPGDVDTAELRQQNLNYYRKALENGSHIACFAEDDGEIVGCVRPEHQGHGTGKRIVRWLVGAALSRGIKKIYLETSEAGRLLYSVLGFSDMKDMMHLSFSK